MDRAVGRKGASPDNELERFKQDINLVELASFYGYELVSKESCRASIVLVHPDGDKIVVAIAPDGHFVFFSVHASASGSVIDFVMYRERVNLGVARQVLRRCFRPGYLDSAAVHYRPKPIPQNVPALYAQWLRMRYYKSRGYLAMRGLSQDTIIAFSNRIRIDERGNVAFRHDDLHSLTGWETKNRGFTGFSGGGRKALFCGKVGRFEEVPLLVITESAIDAMSYYQLQPAPGFYLSFAGAISREQEKLLDWVVNRHSLARVVVATDNDCQGDKYAAQIGLMRGDVQRHWPPIGKDWNDTLMGRKARP